MRPLLFLLISFVASCNNTSPVTILIPSSNDSTISNTTFSEEIKDSLNLVTNKDLQIKIKALLGLWHLTKFTMINKNGDKDELLQSNTTMEFIDDQKLISYVSSIKTECSWNYDSSSNTFTTIAQKMNGNDLEPHIIQKNKVIYLSNNSLIYLYDDPVTATTLEFRYKK